MYRRERMTVDPARGGPLGPFSTVLLIVEPAGSKDTFPAMGGKCVIAQTPVLLGCFPPSADCHWTGGLTGHSAGEGGKEITDRLLGQAFFALAGVAPRALAGLRHTRRNKNYRLCTGLTQVHRSHVLMRPECVHEGHTYAPEDGAMNLWGDEFRYGAQTHHIDNLRATSKLHSAMLGDPNSPLRETAPTSTLPQSTTDQQLW